MTHYLEYINQGRSLYLSLLEPVAKKHHLTMVELTVLLFLKNNPEKTNAKDIVEVRRISKSHASLAISGLEEKGLLQKEDDPMDRRQCQLLLLPAAEPILEEGINAQRQFKEILEQGFTEEELEYLKQAFLHLGKNVREQQEKKNG